VPERSIGSLVVRGLVAVAAAAIVVIAALRSWPPMIVGPTADRQRLDDLQRLSHAIAAFRAEHDVLPASLARLPSPPAAPVRISDPVTGQPYDYRPLGALAYELCARFDAVSSPAERDFWWHDAGRHCYALETRSRPKPPRQGPAKPDPARPEPARPDPPSGPGAGGPTPPSP
jgi:hypothetical protein